MYETIVRDCIHRHYCKLYEDYDIYILCIYILTICITYNIYTHIEINRDFWYHVYSSKPYTAFVYVCVQIYTHHTENAVEWLFFPLLRWNLFHIKRIQRSDSALTDGKGCGLHVLPTSYTSSWKITGRKHFLTIARLNFNWFTFICFPSIQCIAISEQSFNCRFSSSVSCCNITHDDVIKWKHFPRYWTFVRGIHLPPVHFPHKGQWRGALMFSLISALNKRLSKQSWG